MGSNTCKFRFIILKFSYLKLVSSNFFISIVHFHIYSQLRFVLSFARSFVRSSMYCSFRSFFYSVHLVIRSFVLYCLFRSFHLDLQSTHAHFPTPHEVGHSAAPFNFLRPSTDGNVPRIRVFLSHHPFSLIWLHVQLNNFFFLPFFLMGIVDCLSWHLYPS